MRDETPPAPEPGTAESQPGMAEHPEGPRAPTRPPLERSTSHRVVAGVCGGLGRHLNIDPVVFRVVVAVLCLSGGVGLFIYGLAWLIIPVEQDGPSELKRLMSGRVDGQSLGAVLVTVLGTGIFFSYMGDSDHLFPLLLIALLAFAALRYDPDRFQARPVPPASDASAPSDAPPPAPGSKPGSTPAAEPQPPRPGSTAATAAATAVIATDAIAPPAPAWWQRPDPLLKPGTTPPPPPPIPDPEPKPEPGPESWPQPRPEPEPRHRDRSPEQPRRKRSVLGSVFFCLAVITGGTVWAVGVRSHHGVSLLAVLAAGLLVLGLGLIVGTRWGRGRGLVLWATLLTLAVAAVGASPVPLRTSFQHVLWAPAAVGQLAPSYQLGSGQATLDLAAVRPGAGQQLRTRASLGAGLLKVQLPSGPEVVITAKVGAGAVFLPDGSGGGGLSATRTEALNPGGAAKYGTIDLDLSVGAGQVEVTP